MVKKGWCDDSSVGDEMCLAILTAKIIAGLDWCCKDVIDAGECWVGQIVDGRDIREWNVTYDEVDRERAWTPVSLSV